MKNRKTKPVNKMNFKISFYQYELELIRDYIFESSKILSRLHLEGNSVKEIQNFEFNGIWSAIKNIGVYISDEQNDTVRDCLFNLLHDPTEISAIKLDRELDHHLSALEAKGKSLANENPES